MKFIKSKGKTLKDVLPIILIVFGMVGLLASSILMLEKIHLLEDPSYKPSCNINPIISCGSVMVTEQASAFGISNSFVGMIGFAGVVTIGFAMLAGAKFKRWFWLGLQAGTTFGVAFSLWLFYQGIYQIGAICPYCAAIWVASIVLFWYVLLFNLREKHIKLPKKYAKISEKLQKYHGDILFAWLMLIVVLILNRFWYYWSTLI